MANDTPRDQSAVIAELTPIFRDVFDQPELVVQPQMAAKDVAGWDSLTHMDLIVAVEKRYNIKFKLTDIVRFKNVGDMCQAILAAGK